MDGQESPYWAFLDWAQKRLDKMNAWLLREVTARELEGIKAFSPPNIPSNGDQ
ncbi:hypothetical protein [Sphingobium sp. SCG-1]|uniref:hypothetical protein n=1 Tax=Sphingobium sp. SCG-1 TaxID=2072936 RepID=UPI001670FEFA|nr:hypothetical protein [Sphingobium sp. SCG-1]